MDERICLLGWGKLQLTQWLQNEPSYRVDQILDWVYRRRVGTFEAMSNLGVELRTRLAASFRLRSLQLVQQTGSADTTRKFLFQLPDDSLIETVLIPASPALYGSASDRRTLCVSTQVGCAYGCKFCASGLAGFSRNLSAAEIVEQIVQVEAAAAEKVNNLVFMGMGEPLANYSNLLQAIEILNASWGIGIGARHITVSTSGLVPRIRDLAEQPLQIRLAISLHGATDEVRQRIMPINRKYPVSELMDACQYFTARKKQKITFEYILISGVNDRDSDGRLLGRLAAKLGAKVNLIPYNQVDGLDWVRPPEDRQHRFLNLVRAAKVDATIRREKGHDINAACGQLRLRTLQQKAFAGV
jgi:23S rRNA (adenine2503-C2)-methyltransferase